MIDETSKHQLVRWLAEILQEEEFSHAFVVECNVLLSKRVEVFIDADKAVDFDLCRRISRLLEAKLDESLLLGESYTLEVSSPGIKRPMTLPRQFPKHIGRTLIVRLDEKTKITGQLATVSATGFTLKENTVQRDERNKKIKVELTHEVAFGNFLGATVELSFKPS